MANIRKQFNFRNGVQVDDDNLIVSPTGLVGIGTSVPTEALDVRGNLSVTGFATASELRSPTLTISGNATIASLDADSVVSTGVSIGNGIIRHASAGVVTYYGDGGSLQNLPTSQWIDTDVGLGFTSIYSQGNVGVGTTDPRDTFQIGGNNKTNAFFEGGVRINDTGNVVITGITTSGGFTGIGQSITQLNADNIATGTIATARVPQLSNANIPDSLNLTGDIEAQSGFIGDLTGDVTGNLVGIATTARDLTSDARVSIDDLVASTSTVGTSTVTTRLISTGDVGIGTENFDILSDLHIRKGVGISSILVSSDDDLAKITVSRTGVTSNTSGSIQFGNPSNLYPYSGYEDFDIINEGVGNVNTYLHYGFAGINTGNFNWFYGQTPADPLMVLTYEGRLGIGLTTPTRKLDVGGDASVTSDLNVGNNVSVGQSITVFDLYVTNSSTIAGLDLDDVVRDGENINATSGISTFNDLQLLGDVTVADRIGIGTLAPAASLQVGSGNASVVISSNGVGIGTTELSTGIDFDAFRSDALFNSVGVGTAEPTCAADFSCIGAHNVDDDERFLRLPVVNNTQRVQIDDVGAMVANSSTNQIQVYDGADWRRLDTQNSQGITTATGGFTSGTGDPVQISVVGSTLTFTVNGVGSTSLTLS
tara:strand:+ start:9005 stop:10957 length:1953 start_codon:yes stop_codon:yes gene_type:complete